MISLWYFTTLPRCCLPVCPRKRKPSGWSSRPPLLRWRSRCPLLVALLLPADGARGVGLHGAGRPSCFSSLRILHRWQSELMVRPLLSPEPVLLSPSVAADAVVLLALGAACRPPAHGSRASIHWPRPALFLTDLPRPAKTLVRFIPASLWRNTRMNG